MADRFEDESLEAALERSLKNAKHLRAVHASTVKAARMLARKIDAWDVIVEWALEDAEDDGRGRPAVPQNDNVSIASYLKYMETLGLVPEKVAPVAAPKSAPVAPPAPRDQLAEMRSKLLGS